MRTGGRGARRSSRSSSPPPARAGPRGTAGAATRAASREPRAAPASASGPAGGREGAARACPVFAVVRRASTRGVLLATVPAPLPPPSVQFHAPLTFRSVRMLRPSASARRRQSPLLRRMLRPSASARRRQSPLLREIPRRSSLLVLRGSLQCLVRSGTGRSRVRSLAFVQEIAMSGSDDERTITRVVKVWRVLGFVATHANARVHVGIDVTGGIRGVLGPRAVTHLTLDVLPSLAAALEAGAPGSG